MSSSLVSMSLKYRLSECDQVLVVLFIEIQQFNMNHKWPEYTAPVCFKRICDDKAAKMYKINQACTPIAGITADISAASAAFYL